MVVLTCEPNGAARTTLHLGIDLGNELSAGLADLGPGRATFALVDARVEELHGSKLARLGARLSIEGGEECKTFEALERVLRTLAQAGRDRRSILLAVGGGTVGDLAGLAAAVYLRGIDLVQVPTTLLAMLDASVGGKTAINLPEGKNLVGTFHPARLVFVDPAFLSTLPEDHFRSGLAEALKMGIGLSRELFDLMEGRREEILARRPDALLEMIRLAVQAKIALVEEDLRESGPRRLLNLGHTLGHALEARSGWGIPHGFAVARGIHFALDVAVQRGLEQEVEDRCRRLLEAYGFDADPLDAPDELFAFLRRDKKVEGDRLHLVVPTAIGQSRTEAVPLDVLNGLLCS